MLPPAAIYDSSSDSDQHIRGDYRLRNDFIHYLETKKVGWSPSTVSTTGEQFVKTLVSISSMVPRSASSTVYRLILYAKTAAVQTLLKVCIILLR